jgi:hypothetical protein
MFSSGVRWEERIKINGEHEDFYHSQEDVALSRGLPAERMAALHSLWNSTALCNASVRTRDA